MGLRPMEQVPVLSSGRRGYTALLLQRPNRVGFDRLEVKRCLELRHLPLMPTYATDA